MTSGGRWPQGEDPDEERPWAVYGEEPGGTTPTRDSSHLGAPDVSTPYPSYQQWGAPDAGAQHSGDPYSKDPYSGSPYPGSPHPGTPYAGGGGRPVAKDLPSRTGAILTIITGALLALVVAPVVLVSMVLQGIGFSTAGAEDFFATNGGQVTVGESGTIGLTDSSGTSPGNCVLEGPGGTYETEPELDGAIAVARGLTPGQYTISCEGALPGAQLMVLAGPIVDSMVSVTLKAMGVASAIGVAGFAAVIIGIVWLTRKNRERRRIWQGF